MKFKFQIVDLLVITTWFASMAAAFQADLILFRQLLCISLVALTSTTAVLILPDTKNKVQFVGGVGGMIGGLVYLVIALLFARFLYESQSASWIQRSDQSWSGDIIPAVILSVLFGATIGPLLAIRFRQQLIAKKHRRLFWFSIVLLMGIFLLGVFAMFERQTMQGRDWFIVSIVLSVVFVINTNQLLTRVWNRKAGPNENKTQS